jgi:SAM-dependent methyltransferase
MMDISVGELYGELWADDPAFEARLRDSLQPRSADTLYSHFGGYNVTAQALVLDVGCRDAGHTIELARRFGCRAVAVDPVPQHLDQARAAVAEAGLTDRISVAPGVIETLPLDAASVSHIWCRDMLNHVDLRRALPECVRVLQPNGILFVYQTFATPLCEAQEAQRLYTALAMRPENMSPHFFETQAAAAGLRLVERDVISSEWREYWLEHGQTGMLDDLLRLARLRRREAELVARFGRKRYEAAYGGSLWGIYQMLGKLEPRVYVLQK